MTHNTFICDRFNIFEYKLKCIGNKKVPKINFHNIKINA